MIAISDVFRRKKRSLGYDRRRKAMRQVALGNASSAAGHHRITDLTLMFYMEENSFGNSSSI